MRIKSRFVFDIPDEADARKLYEIAGIKFPSKRPTRLYVMELFNDTSEYENLMAYLEAYPPEYYQRDEDEVFTEEELLVAPLLRMVPNAHRGGYPQPESGERENNYLSCSFDLQSGCPGCSKGLLQNRPLRLSGGVKMGKTNDISGIWWLRDYVVTKKLRDLIEKAGLTGVEFWPIIKHGSGKPFDDLFQLKITGVLPRMSPQTMIKFDPLTNYKFACKYGCGALYVEGRIHYRACDIAEIPDFALTQEWLGSGYEFWRWPFMSHKAYQLFYEKKIKGIRWYPPAIDV